MGIDLVDGVIEIDTWDYFVRLTCTDQQLEALRAHFPFHQEPLMKTPYFKVTTWDVEDREALQNYLQEHCLDYSVDCIVRRHDD